MDRALAIVACLALAAAIMVPCAIAIARVSRRTREGLAEGARRLGLEPIPVTGAQAWQGEVDGVDVRIGSRWRRAEAAPQAVLLENVVEALLPRPLGYPLALGQNAFLVPRNVETGEPAFDREVAVQAADPAAAARLLADPALRSAILDLRRGYHGLLWITDEVVRLKLVDVHRRGPDRVVAAARDAVRLARRLAPAA